MHELSDLRFDDRLRLLDRGATRVEIRRDELGQIIQRIEEDVIQRPDLDLDVARHGEIHHEDRPAAPRAQGSLDQPFPQNRQRRGSAGDDDIVLVQMLAEGAQLDRASAKAMCERLRALQRAVGDGDAGRILRREVRGTQLDHFAGPDEQHLLLVQAGKDPRRELDRSRRHRHAVRANARGRAHFLGDRKRALKQLVQHGAQRPRVFRRARRLLHLTEDLRLPQHHRVQTGCDAKRVAYRVVARQGVDVG